MNAQDGVLVNTAFKQLLNRTPREIHIELNYAFNLALFSHGRQRRKTGEPYILHPIAVACILAVDLDNNHPNDRVLIAAALLHDCIEDTAMELRDLDGVFAREVRNLVYGLTKVQDGEKMGLTASWRHLIRAAHQHSYDVFLLSIGDRLHNMRTLHGLSRKRRRRMAIETLCLFVPLALWLLGIRHKVTNEFIRLGLAYIAR